MEKIEVIADLSRHKMVTKTTDLSTLYSLCQSNGQIIATFKHASTPKRGSEVYIKHIKEDTLLQDVLEFAMKAGQVFQIRLLMEFSGYLRSYCFVTYFSVKAARKAILTLNGASINGNPVVVKVSYDNNRLEIRNVPKVLCFDQLREQFHELIGVGLKDVKMCRYSSGDSKFKKCLLLYDTHRNALEARKKLYPKFKVLDSYIMEIDWAAPEELKMCCRLYFRTLPKSVTKIQLYDCLENYIRVEGMLNIFLQRGLGYILFVSQFEAYQAYGKLTGKRICGEYLEYSFSRFFEHLTIDEPEHPSVQDDASSDNSTYGETASSFSKPEQKPTNVGYFAGRPIFIDQGEIMNAGEPLETPVQAQTSCIPSYIPEFPDEMKLLQNFMIPSSVQSLNQAPVITPNLHPYSLPVQTSGTMPPIYTPMMFTPPSAVPVPTSCPLATMNGYGAALPVMTTPLPNPLPNCYYFNNVNVNHYLRSGCQRNTNAVLNQAYLNLMNPQLEQFPLMAEYNQIQPATNLFLTAPWY